MSGQGLEPDDVWTREYVRTELWGNVYGEPLPVDADPGPGDVVLTGLDVLARFVMLACESVLDVGCGWVWYSIPDHVSFVGADVSPEMLELARSLHPRHEFVETSAFDLPFDDDSFCGVRSSGMLRHIEEWEPALDEMIRVAGDRMAFTHLTSDDPGKCGKYQWSASVEDVLSRLPDGSDATVETHKPKEAHEYESSRFMVVLP